MWIVKYEKMQASKQTKCQVNVRMVDPVYGNPSNSAFPIAQVRLLFRVHVYFSQTNNWPQLLTGRNMPFVTQTAVEIYSTYTLHCLFFFLSILLLSISFSRSHLPSHMFNVCMHRLFQNDMAENAVSLYDFYHNEKPPDEQFKPILFFILFSLRSQMTQRNGGFTPDKRYLYSFTVEHLYAPCSHSSVCRNVSGVFFFSVQQHKKMSSQLRWYHVCDSIRMRRNQRQMRW